MLETKVPDPIVNEISVVTYDNETDLVSMPLWYWLDLTEYIIEIESLKEFLTK